MSDKDDGYCVKRTKVTDILFKTLFLRKLFGSGFFEVQPLKLQQLVAENSSDGLMDGEFQIPDVPCTCSQPLLLHNHYKSTLDTYLGTKISIHLGI